MAHSSALHVALAELADSFLPAEPSSTRKRRLKDAFARQVRYHNYGRTNQFEVAERLDGLEEKFQVLDRDELSDALWRRRRELAADHDIPWLPDALDLLLRLSEDPVNQSRVERLSEIEPRPAAMPPALKWVDVEAADPVDRRDPIWLEQDYSDLSSEEDSFLPASAATSPVAKNDSTAENPVRSTASLFLDSFDPDLRLSNLQKGMFWRSSDSTVIITEIQALRESLFMLQGLDTTLFHHGGGEFLPAKRFQLQHVSAELLMGVLMSLAQAGSAIYSVRRWADRHQSQQYLQTLRDGVIKIIARFDAFVSEIHTKTLNPHGHEVVTITALPQDVQIRAFPLLTLSSILESLENRPGGISLDALYEEICIRQPQYPSSRIDELVSLFLETLRIYMKPIDLWLHKGEIDDSLDGFFVRNSSHTEDLRRLWSDWCMLDVSSGLPRFIEPHVKEIFACGKTALFLRHLDHDSEYLSTGLLRQRFQDSFQDVLTDNLVPFSEKLANFFESLIAAYQSRTAGRLKWVLENQCGLWSTLSAFQYLYFGKHGPITEAVDAKIFTRIDRCNEAWNDRFLVAELLEEKFRGLSIEFNRVAVQGRYVSSRTMASRRQSVKILGDLSFEYLLPWPLANIISQSVMGSCRRVALLLSQVRRARYVLLRQAHFFVHNGLLYLDSDERKFAQTLHYRLRLFTEILYDHLTSCVIEQMTTEVWKLLRESSDVDGMIMVFNRYASGLEEACITVKKLKVAHDALVVVLDLCIRFSDVVSMPTSIDGRKSSDFEASSFISAVTNRERRRRARHDGDLSSEDEDDGEELSEGEGYSSFVVLEETTPLEEVHKIDGQFQRQLAFIVAALRGMAASGKSERAVGWEILADRLDWKTLKPGE